MNSTKKNDWLEVMNKIRKYSANQDMIEVGIEVRSEVMNKIRSPNARLVWSEVFSQVIKEYFDAQT